MNGQRDKRIERIRGRNSMHEQSFCTALFQLWKLIYSKYTDILSHVFTSRFIPSRLNPLWPCAHRHPNLLLLIPRGTLSFSQPKLNGGLGSCSHSQRRVTPAIIQSLYQLLPVEKRHHTPAIRRHSCVNRTAASIEGIGSSFLTTMFVLKRSLILASPCSFHH